MDIVITHCNQNDFFWKKEYDATIKKEKDVIHNANDHNRYLDMNTLQYLLRSIHTYVSDVDNVFLVVSGPSQVPKWINRNTVKVVYHKDFIPEKYLPTFNARTIETFLHLIPGLNEKFLFFNDDMIILQKCGESDFFTEDGGIKVNFVKDYVYKRTNKTNKVYGFVYHRDCVEGAKKAGVVWDNLEIIRTDHGPYPLYKSVYEDFYNDIKDNLDECVTTFRSDRDLCLHFRACAYMYFAKKVKKQPKTTAYINLPQQMENFQNVVNCFQRNRNILSCVVQDNYNTEEDGKRCFAIINNTFSNRFPYISKYEFCNPVLQVIVKNENKYLKEWVNHHLSLGIEKIIILDNNDIGGEVISDEIKHLPQVEIRNFRGRTVIQNRAYSMTVFSLNPSVYSHLITIDADEFIGLNDCFNNNIKSYLSNYKIHNADQIKLNWRLRNEDDVVYGDPNIPLKERNYSSYPNKYSELDLFENSNSKCIVTLRDKYNRNLKWVYINPHVARSSGITSTVDNRGDFASNTVRIGANYDCAWVDHYRYKSTSEMCEKMARGYPDQIISRNRIIDTINRYLILTGNTTEKLKCIKEYFKWFDESMLSDIYDNSGPSTKDFYGEYVEISD